MGAAVLSVIGYRRLTLNPDTMRATDAGACGRLGEELTVFLEDALARPTDGTAAWCV